MLGVTVGIRFLRSLSVVMWRKVGRRVKRRSIVTNFFFFIIYDLRLRFSLGMERDV